MSYDLTGTTEPTDPLLWCSPGAGRRLLRALCFCVLLCASVDCRDSLFSTAFCCRQLFRFYFSTFRAAPKLIHYISTAIFCRIIDQQILNVFMEFRSHSRISVASKLYLPTIRNAIKPDIIVASVVLHKVIQTNIFCRHSAKKSI